MRTSHHNRFPNLIRDLASHWPADPLHSCIRAGNTLIGSFIFSQIQDLPQLQSPSLGRPLYTPSPWWCRSWTEDLRIGLWGRGSTGRPSVVTVPRGCPRPGTHSALEQSHLPGSAGPAPLWTRSSCPPLAVLPTGLEPLGSSPGPSSPAPGGSPPPLEKVWKLCLLREHVPVRGPHCPLRELEVVGVRQRAWPES